MPGHKDLIKMKTHLSNAQKAPDYLSANAVRGKVYAGEPRVRSRAGKSGNAFGGRFAKGRFLQRKAVRHPAVRHDGRRLRENDGSRGRPINK